MEWSRELKGRRVEHDRYGAGVITMVWSRMGGHNPTGRGVQIRVDGPKWFNLRMEDGAGQPLPHGLREETP